MKQATVGLVTATLAALSVVALAGQSTPAPQATKPIASHGPGLATPESQTAVVKQYCTGCHSDRGKAGNLSLVSFDAAKVTSNIEIDPRMTEATTGVTLKTPPIHIAAGPRRISAAFISQFEGPVIDLMAPIDHTLADTQIGVAFGITTLPHLKDLSVVGPYKTTGVSETPSRRKVFTLSLIHI